MVRRPGAVLVVVAALSGGCGQAGPRDTGTAAPPVAGRTEAPDVAQIVCDEAGTHALTPLVRPQADGVHVRVENTTGEDLLFQFPSGGRGADRGTTELVLVIEPGPTEVRCHRLAEDAGAPGGYVDLEVIDPEGVWVSTHLDCQSFVSGIVDYVPGTSGQIGDPVDIARRDSPSWSPETSSSGPGTRSRSRGWSGW